MPEDARLSNPRMIRNRSIGTRKGHEFHPLRPQIDAVDVFDIGHATSMKCRYTGHSEVFFSVGQHQVFVADILEAWGQPPLVQLQGLVHDATEAYLPDIASPLKSSVYLDVPGRGIIPFRDHETRLEEIICFALEIPWPFPEAVKEADGEAFRHEYLEIMPLPPWVRPHPPADKWDPIRSWSPEEGRSRWLTRYYELRGKL